MVTYRWSVGFALPRVWLERAVQIGRITLQPAPCDENGDPQSTGSLLLETEEFLDITDIAARAMQEIEPVAISASATLGSVLSPRITSLCLQNRQELEAAGLPSPSPVPRPHLDAYVIAPVPDEAKLGAGYLAAVGLPPDERQRLHLVARWLWKANSEHDPHDALLALWISFNVLYGPFWALTKDERKAIECYAAQRIAPSAAARLLGGARIDASLRRLADSRLTLRTRRIGEELRAALAKSLGAADPVELMRLALLSVYAVRCDVVHKGHVLLDRYEEFELLRASRDPLKGVIMHALQTQLGLS